MPRGRTSREAAILRRAVSGCVESLESRRMLTTLQGGDVFDYIDANDNRVRVSLSGDIVAEFIAARVRPSDNSVVIRDLVPWPGKDATTDGADLFHIYIAAASEDARISISTVTDDGKIVPYEGDVGDIQINAVDEDFEPIRVTPDGGGQVYIGARTKDIDAIEGTDEADLPIIYNTYRSDYGVRPGTRGIYAGIETAPGVSLGRILVGGTLTGRVYIDGNLETLYANDILTGDVGGNSAGGTSSLPNNIFIGGDLRNLLAAGSIGTAENEVGYRTASEVRVGGKLGNVRTGVDFDASVFVVNNPDVQGIIAPFAEIEGAPSSEVSDFDFIAGEITATEFSNNEATSTQFASSSGSTITGLSQSIDFTGNLDDVDNFSLPLIAGQKAVIQLFSDFVGNIGVFDPLGRLVATDYADIAGGGQGQAFVLTATVPGTYRLAVAFAGNSTFESTSDGSPLGSPYTLSISEYGEVAVGGIRAAGDLSLNGAQQGVNVRSGDIGTIWSDGTVSGAELSPIQASRGNLRSLHGDELGAVNLVIPRGTVGFVDSDGDININPSAVDDDGALPGYAVGFDYQRVQADGAMLGNLVANRAIGTIVADSIPGAPQFIANADNRGEDGRIDLIDVTGDFGSIATGGPGLYTGLGGNVKYVRVGGDVYRDFFFGFTLQSDIVVPTGQSIQITDDSGASAILAPTSVTTTTTGGTGGGTTTTVTPGQLTLTAYGVRESGGVIIINLTSTTSVSVSATNRVGSFDITELTTEGDGTPVVYNEDLDVVEFERATTTPPTPTTPPTGINRTVTEPNAITLSGRAPVNVMSISGGNITNITNGTEGEIGAVEADTVGTLLATSIGSVKSSTAAEVLPNTNIPSEEFPFNEYSFGLNISGPVLEILSREAVGDIYVSGEIGLVRANADAKNNSAVFEGINGVLRGTIIQRVDIGEGVAWGGSGLVVGGGIFAQGGETSYIGQIVGNNADIRGTIGSEGRIDDIFLNNGSIINAYVATPTDVSLLTPFPTVIEVIDNQPEAEVGVPYAPEYSIGTIRISGNGGIMGSFIRTADFNAIDVRGGYGIINTAIISYALYNANNVIAADGLGIRESLISASTSLNRLEARGDGSVLDVNQFSPSVLQSVGRRKFDAYTGRTLGGSNDLHKYLGTSKTNSAISGVTNSGIMENVNASGALELGKVSAFLIRDDINNPISPSSARYPSRFAFANKIGTIKTASAIMGLQVRTGKLDEINAGGNIEDVAVNVSGKLGTIASGRNIRGTASFEARGPEGEISWVYARLGLYGTVTASRDIKKIQTGYLGNTTESLGKINELRVTNDVLTGTYVRASNGIGTLFVGGDVQPGAKISAKSYGTTTILGANNGEVVVE